MRSASGGESVRVGLAARRDRLAGVDVFARYSAAPVHQPTPIVLLHGLVVSSLFLRPALELLGNSHRTLAPDLAGYGRSAKPPGTLGIYEQADLLAAWLDELGLERIVLGGVSMGSQFASALAARHPQRVAGLVLASPTMDPRYRRWPQAVQRWLLEAPSELAMAGISLRDVARAGLARTIRSVQLVLADRPEDRLPGLDMPALVIYGRSDRLLSREWVEHVASLLPNGRLEIVDGAAHALNFSSPEAFARLVRDFALELSQSARATA